MVRLILVCVYRRLVRALEMDVVKRLRERHGAECVQVRYHGGVVYLTNSPIVRRGSGAQYLSPRGLMMHAYSVIETAETVARVETVVTTRPMNATFKKQTIKRLLEKFNADEVVVRFPEASVHFKKESISVKEGGVFVVRDDLKMLAKKIVMNPEAKWRGVVMTKAVHSELTTTERQPFP